MPIDLERKLGSGRFGERHLGRDAETGRELLVTRLRLEASGLEESRKARAIEAARRCQGLVHPHIATLVTAGFTRPGQFIVAQELPPGSAGPPVESSADSGLETLIHLCEGLAYAHARGMVHGALTRDCVSGGGSHAARITDFGVGAALYEAGALAPLARRAPEIAPEVKAGGEPTPAGDVYSLGVIGLELCGPPSEPTESAGETSSAERARRVPGVGLASVLTRAVEADPKARFATAEEMLAHLRRLSAPRPAAAPARKPRERARPRRRPTPEPEPPEPPDMTRAQAFGRLTWALARSFLALLLALCLIAAAVAGGLALALRETPGLVTVPDLQGTTVAEAAKAAEGKGLQVTIGRDAHSEDVPAGRVIDHLPYAGKMVRQGRTVELVVSLGPPRAKVPNLVGKSRGAARGLLESAKLRLGTVSRRPGSEKPADQVLAQNPQPDKEVPIDTEVNIIVSGNRRIATGPSREGPRAADVSFVVPEGPVVQRVKVEVHYPNGRYTVAYERVHRPGDKQDVHVVASGEATVQILIDGELVAEYDLEPSP